MVEGSIDWEKMHEIMKEETDKEIAALEQRVRELEADRLNHHDEVMSWVDKVGRVTGRERRTQAKISIKCMGF